MLPLLLTLLALAVAPLLHAAIRGRPAAEAVADGFAQVAVAGLLLAHVLPEGLMAVGWPAILALGLGVLGGLGAHRLPGGEGAAETLAVIALLLHCVVDGAALATDVHGAGMLSGAVILHTLPVGLATWRITTDRRGTMAAVLLLGLSGVLTVAGYAAADAVLTHLPESVLPLAQCAAAGALLHVLTHLGEGAPRSPFAWGAVGGVALVVLLLGLERSG